MLHAVQSMGRKLHTERMKRGTGEIKAELADHPKLNCNLLSLLAFSPQI